MVVSWINYFNDFNLFTKQPPNIALIANNNAFNNNNIVSFHTKTNYNAHEFFDNTPQPVSPSQTSSFMLKISTDIDDFVKCVQTGKDLLNKNHCTKVKRLSLCYKRNLQNQERVDEMILKLSSILNEQREVIKVSDD